MPKGKSRKKSPKGKTSAAGGGLKGAAKAGAKALGIGGGGGGGKRRNRGPQYWANRVIVERLKQKYRRLKFGSVR